MANFRIKYMQQDEVRALTNNIASQFGIRKDMVSQTSKKLVSKILDTMPDDSTLAVITNDNKQIQIIAKAGKTYYLNTKI